MKTVPVEERLRARAIKPDIIIQVQIVSISMSWINLFVIRMRFKLNYQASEPNVHTSQFHIGLVIKYSINQSQNAFDT